jgi:hypothetical protein
VKRRAHKRGTYSLCPVCGKRKGENRVEIVVRAARREPNYEALASRSVTVCGDCADGIYDAAVKAIPRA